MEAYMVHVIEDLQGSLMRESTKFQIYQVIVVSTHLLQGFQNLLEYTQCHTWQDCTHT